jgi:hypothetical protein
MRIFIGLRSDDAAVLSARWIEGMLTRWLAMPTATTVQRVNRP